jgi:hypothetical protein
MQHREHRVLQLVRNERRLVVCGGVECEQSGPPYRQVLVVQRLEEGVHVQGEYCERASLHGGHARFQCRDSSLPRELRFLLAAASSARAQIRKGGYDLCAVCVQCVCSVCAVCVQCVCSVCTV